MCGSGVVVEFGVFVLQCFFGSFQGFLGGCFVEVVGMNYGVGEDFDYVWLDFEEIVGDVVYFLFVVLFDQVDGVWFQVGDQWCVVWGDIQVIQSVVCDNYFDQVGEDFCFGVDDVVMDCYGYMFVLYECLLLGVQDYSFLVFLIVFLILLIMQNVCFGR